MSKELEAFNKIVDLKYELEDIVYDLPTCFDLTELDGDEESIVEKGLNALDIIKESFDFDFATKFPDMQPILMITNKHDGSYSEIPLTIEQNALLKEVLL